jgi:hypothetical protein
MREVRKPLKGRLLGETDLQVRSQNLFGTPEQVSYDRSEPTTPR